MNGITNPFDVIARFLAEAFDSLTEYAFNYMFGVLALIFWIKFISTAISGRINLIALISGLIFTAMAITAGQDFWKVLPIFS